MYERGNYLKRAFYHVMKMEMKRNKAMKYEGYKQDNAEMNTMFSRGEMFETSVIYVEDGVLCLSSEFFKLKGKEQETLLQYMTQFCDKVE